MEIKLLIPKLDAFPDGFLAHWAGVLFRGTGIEHRPTYAVLMTYVRLVEGAYVHYRAAREETEAYRNGGSVRYLLSSATHFEDCINLTDRSISCLQKLYRSRELPEDLKTFLSEKFSVVKNPVQTRVHKLRNAVQHFENQMFKGEIPEGTPFGLMATGGAALDYRDPRSMPALQIIDRLRLGNHEILLKDLVLWLQAIGQSADFIASYQWLS